MVALKVSDEKVLINNDNMEDLAYITIKKTVMESSVVMPRVTCKMQIRHFTTRSLLKIPQAPAENDIGH